MGRSVDDRQSPALDILESWQNRCAELEQQNAALTTQNAELDIDNGALRKRRRYEHRIFGIFLVMYLCVVSAEIWQFYQCK